MGGLCFVLCLSFFFFSFRCLDKAYEMGPIAQRKFCILNSIFGMLIIYGNMRELLKSC